MNQPKFLTTLVLSLMLSAFQASAIDAPSEVAKAAAKGDAAGKADAAPAPSAPAMAVDEILRRNAEARGGAAAWKKVQTLSFSGKMDAGRKHPDPDNQFGNPNASAKERRKSRIMRERELDNAPMIQLPYTLELARGRKSHLEVNFQDKVAVQVYDGSTGWKRRPWLAPDRQLQPYSADELKLAADQSDLDGWLLDAAAKGNKVEGEGVDGVDGKAAYKLKVTLANGDVRHVWVDAENFLDIKIESARRFDGKLKPLYVMQKDFRTVDGIKLPFLMESRVEGGRDTDRLVVDKVAVNPQLAASRFGKP